MLALLTFASHQPNKGGVELWAFTCHADDAKKRQIGTQNDITIPPWMSRVKIKLYVHVAWALIKSPLKLNLHQLSVALQTKLIRWQILYKTHQPRFKQQHISWFFMLCLGSGTTCLLRLLARHRRFRCLQFVTHLAYTWEDIQGSVYM